MQSVFFSAQQNDFLGLELGDGGTHYEFRSGIFWEDLGHLIVSYDASFTGASEELTAEARATLAAYSGWGGLSQFPTGHHPPSEQPEGDRFPRVEAQGIRWN